MNLGLMYYLLVAVTSFGVVFFTITFILLAIWIGGIVVYSANYLDNKEYRSNKEENEKQYELIKWHVKRALACLIFTIVLNAAIPGKKDMLIIAGLSLTNETLKNTAIELKNTVPSLVKLINDEIKELTEDNDESKKEQNK